MHPPELEFRRIYQQLTFHLDNSPLAVIEWDQQLSVKRWSPQAETLLGWTAAEMLDQAWDDRKFVHQDDIELVKAVRARLLTGEDSHNTCLHRNYTKDQAVVYCEWHHSALRDESGQVVSVLSWVQDVTEREMEALKQSQTLRKQQVIAELSQCALNQTNLDTLLKQATSLVAETLGVKFVQILELLPNEKTFLLTAGVGWQSGSVGRVTMGTGRKSQSGYTVLTQEPVIVEDLRVETRFSGSAFLHNHKVISGVTVQILGKEKPFGVLGVYSQSHQSFSEDDIHFLKVIANIISAAVERQQREDELNRFFNLSLDIFCIASVDGYFKRINPRFAALLGYTEAELLTPSLLSFLHPDDITPTVLELENLALGIPRYNFENRYQCKNGSYRWLSWTAMPFDDNYFYAVARDITDSKQTEAALRNSEKRYANLMEVSPVGIFHTDTQGNCLYVNQRWLEITGLSSENALGMGWLQAIHPEDYDQVAQEWNQAADQQIPFQSEYRFQRQDGKITWVFGQAVAEVNEQGETIGYVGTITDITDRKQAEEELKQFNEELEDRVADRTTQLSFMNEKLQRQISELQAIEAQLEIKVYQQAIIAKLGQKALSETNLSCLINEAVMQVAEDLKVQYCKLIEWNGDEIGFLTLAIEDKASESYVLLSHEPIQIDHKSYCFNTCMNSGCHQQKSTEELLDYASFHLFNRGICIPILGQNHHHLGQLEIYGKNLQIFTEDDVHYLQSVSHILASAIERKQAEEAIRSSEQLYRLMADHSTDLISRHTGDGVYLYASPACRSLLGYEPEELIGHSAYEFFHPEDLPNINQYYQNLTQNSPVKTIVYRMISKDQKYVWFETTSKMVLDTTDNSVPKIVAVSRDITDRKLTEDRLKAANEQLQAVLDAVPGFVSWISADLHYLGVNRHLAVTYNLKPEDFVGQEIGFLQGSHEFAQFMEKFMGETYLKTSEVTLETNIQGSTRYYLLVAQKYNQDQAAIFVGIDITDRKRIEEQLWATTCRLSALIDNLQLGVLVQDESFQVVLINQAFCNLFGIQVPPEELIGLEGAELFCDYQHLFSDATQFALRNREVMRRKRLLNNEEISLTDGRVLERDYVPILIQGNNSQGHLWMYRDITERKNAESKLVTSLREKEVLLKEIHHRVKNNLFVVSNLLEFQTDYVQEPELIKVLDDSRNRIYSMALIHEKLYRSTNLDQVNFGEYLEDLVDNLFESYNVQSGLIEFELEIEPVSLNIETAQPCGLIVNELISNTLKHAFPDSRAGIVYLGLQQDGESGQITLTVRDNGVGFPEDIDFRNVESLGMELVCTLTDQLEGTITLERNQGTIFTVSFYELQYRHRLS